jgi:glycosyltransferase involved in cell wall biosynthesis/2-polyprenyl-3-methyl-5-hydroxy-6-metoxy-1,4-benzoquinol methylase
VNLTMPRNLIYVCHCDFRGNSGIQLLSIARALTDLGHSCAVCVPERPETILDRGTPRFQVLDYEEAMTHGVSFANDRGPDLVHAWTPREMVRKTTVSLARRYKIPYFVHLEDNENILLLDNLPGWSLEDLERLPTRALDLLVPIHCTHPHYSRRLMAEAAGVTALIDRLLEFKPAYVPGIVFFPGYDPEFAKIDGRDEELRATLGIRPEELVVVYTGNVHGSNFQEVRSLVLAVALANRRGFRVKLVRAGLGSFPPSEFSGYDIAQHVIECGFVPHREIPRLLAAADVLVQPGRAGAFNDYRFPSKLPEFLASGRPVILPRSNIGLLVKDGEEAIVLGHGHSAEIADALERLTSDAELRVRIGKNGRAFALNNLDWAKTAATLPGFYDKCLAKSPSSLQPGIADEETAVPKLIAFYMPQFHSNPKNGAGNESSIHSAGTGTNRAKFAKRPQARIRADLDFYDEMAIPAILEEQVALARRFGIFGFCFYYYWFDGRRLLERPLNHLLGRPQPDFPFCICWANENWTRRWPGHEEILIKQEYREDFSLKFIRDVIPILKDRRYLRVHGDPILLVYRVSLLPDPHKTAEIWRAECRKAGIPSVHLVATQSDGVRDPRRVGFDAAVECPPDTRTIFGNGQGLSDAQAIFDDHLGDDRKGPIDQPSNRPPVYTFYRNVMALLENSLRSKEQGHIHRSTVRYQAQLRRATAQTMMLAELQAPLLFVNSWNDRKAGAMLEPDVNGSECFLEATRHGLSEGFADYLRALAISVEGRAIPKFLMSNQDNVVRSNRVQKGRQRYKTEDWFADEQLRGIADRYRGKFATVPLSFATVRDYCDSFDNLRPIATVSGDLKDNQRPWVLKAILSMVRRGGRILEIGAGEPFVADIFDRLGYEVWVVDPYDGTGNGPVEYERFRNECPGVHFVRGFFGEQLLSAPPGGFDCIYSISVLEHVPAEALNGVFAGIKKYLRPNGWSIHAVDHVRKGHRAAEHYENLKTIAHFSGFKESELLQLIERMDADPETYYLSAESHNRWRGSLPYDEFPMRVCISIQLVSRAGQLRVMSDETK